MTAVVITASLETDWVRPLASLRARGVACVVVALDPVAFAGVGERPTRETEAASRDRQPRPRAQRARALRHALAELTTYAVTLAGHSASSWHDDDRVRFASGRRLPFAP